MRIESAEALRAAMGADFVLSEPQWRAVSAPLEPAVVIAGAGSGKTTLMAARVVYLVLNELVLPEQVLGLTFTTKAAAELRRRIVDALRAAGALPTPGAPAPGPSDVAEPTVATYNAYAAALLTEHGLRIGHEPDTRVLADASRFQLAGRVVARHPGRIEQLSDHPETVIANLLGLDSAISEHLTSPERVRVFDAGERVRFVAAAEAERSGRARKTYLKDVLAAISAIDRRGELLDLVEGYRAAKLRHGVMDFSDQIALTAELAQSQPDVSAVERDRFRVVLLDEYQDTSVAQARMLGLLFSGADQAGGRGHPVTAVGDPNQAIYGWRGASVSNILHFADDFPPASARAVPTYPLVVNRRSDQRILHAANRLAEPLYAASPGVEPLVAKPGAAAGEVATRCFEHADDELAWLAEQVPEAARAARAAAGGGPGRARVGAPEAGPLWSEVGVLTRDNAHAARVYDVLTRADVPVEIVGLSGLIRLPEVAEVVATLRLLHDLTANDAMLTLLTGPRWALGPRDLALLGRRAAQIAGAVGRRAAADSGGDQGREAAVDVATELARVVEGSDPTEIPALCDAIESPGEAAYSPAARERLGLLAAELRALRAYAGEPLLDLVRRIIDTCGIDVELAASLSPAASARRDNLDLFVKAVADFQAVDGTVTLPALLAYLTAEDELGTGLDVATPTEANSVKLLTVHRAKGLEWASVFVVGAGRGRFPTSRGRPTWVTSPAVLPNPLRGDARDLAVLRGHDKAGIEEFKAASRAVEQAEELRLGYVALTRAKHRLELTSYLWGTRKSAFGPSPFQETVAACMAEWGEKPEPWSPCPEGRVDNPHAERGTVAPWPVEARTAEVERRLAAAALVTAAMAGTGPSVESADRSLDLVEASRVAQWDADIERLLAEAAGSSAEIVTVPLPTSLSATSLARLQADPSAFARELARPMPRPPSPAARFGTRFHAWVEARFGQQQMIDPDELPGREDVGVEDERELAHMIERFEAGPFADRAPVALEAPFALVLAGQVIRGRIDAVYAEGDGYLVVDWKTSRQQSADPLQLAIYRLGWAELVGVPLERVRAAFHYVRSGETVVPDPTTLPARSDLERLLIP